MSTDPIDAARDIHKLLDCIVDQSKVDKARIKRLEHQFLSLRDYFVQMSQIHGGDYQHSLEMVNAFLEDLKIDVTELGDSRSEIPRQSVVARS